MKLVILIIGLALLNTGFAYWNYTQGDCFGYGFNAFAAGFCLMGAVAIYLDNKQ